MKILKKIITTFSEDQKKDAKFIIINNKNNIIDIINALYNKLSINFFEI